MKYRKMDESNENLSLLGFGCMRFPMTKDGKIEEKEAEKMLDQAIANGVTYIDTAYPYHDGDSEPFVGRVLNKYDRASFKLATKLPIWEIHSAKEAKKLFEAQLARLNVEYIDFYLLHALDKEKWAKVLELDILAVVEEYQRVGKIKHLGFSFHDSYEVFEDILTYRKWDFCQLQYNYMDTDIQAGERGCALSEKMNVPLIIMEPVKGGALARLPEDIEKIFTDYNPEASAASWALRWLANHKNVKVILSGMSTLQQVEDNIHTFEACEPLNEEEMAVVDRVKQTILSRQKNGCTGCAYCMPCPFDVAIPRNFEIWNEEGMYQDHSLSKKYEMLGGGKAEKCRECGECEKLCPQNLPIREDLKQVIKDVSLTNESFGAIKDIKRLAPISS